MGNRMRIDSGPTYDDLYGSGGISAPQNADYSAGPSSHITVYSTPGSVQPYNPPNQQPYDPPVTQQQPMGGAPQPGMPQQMGGGQPPAPQSKPVMSDVDWLNSDQTYLNQQTQLNSALSDFLKRLTTQRENFTTDYNTATQGLARNRQANLLGLGEDMTARGLGNSGLFTQQRQLMNQNFDNQQGALDKSNERANFDFDNQQRDKNTSTSQALANAQQESLSRRAAQMMF